MFRGYESLRVETTPSVAHGLWRIGEMLGTDDTLIAGSFPLHLAMKHFNTTHHNAHDGGAIVMEFYTSKQSCEVSTLIKAARVQGVLTDVKVTPGQSEHSGGMRIVDDTILRRESDLARELGVTQTIREACEAEVLGAGVSGSGSPNVRLRVTTTISGRIIDGCVFKIICAPEFCPHTPRRLFECFDWDVLRVAASPPVSATDTHLIVHMSRHTRRAIKARTAHFTSRDHGLAGLRDYESLSGGPIGLSYSSEETTSKAFALHRAVMRGVRLMRLGFSLSPDDADSTNYLATLDDMSADAALGDEEGLSRVAMLSAEIEHAERTIFVVEHAERAFSAAVSEAFGEAHPTGTLGASATGPYIASMLWLIKMDLSEDRILLAAIKPRFYRTVYSCGVP